jgi:ribosomal protein S18 acetylase RimI-like enzyme
MKVTYKTISQEDIEILVNMMQDFYAIDGYPINVETSKQLFHKFIAEQNLGKAWLIQSDGQAAGYVIMTFVFNFEYGGLIAFIDELYIKEGMRGKGLGKSAIDFILSEAKKIGLKLLYLEVERHNEKANHLYYEIGFEKHKRDILKFQIK